MGVCSAAGDLGLGVAHRVEIALTHDNKIVGADEHGAEGMMPVRRRFARDIIERAKGAEITKRVRPADAA